MARKKRFSHRKLRIHCNVTVVHTYNNHNKNNNNNNNSNNNNVITTAERTTIEVSRLPGQISRCTLKFTRIKCNESCD